ncbi:PhzF family phenazine biosynthesis protein [Mesorhizobium sp.]|uniref:PhzF family phenazine biosynthesis protein n=1 Tax=Mesorhizobium sp. TaxID=1871066 RepID=UPI000FEA19BA|nr:PhzF family phenazine biosynthesis protein [Mesorhizobium sp.]RWK63135.1 MAG: PhzF family phenazine biosynthesis protein [Mesorhizobium sp.]RWM50161.1 MAG: PhzF family phenazine biosynthesis protein [Mesorhizobium sp.]RWM57097.1 MAG: PhzF family phenazine biosynthesis protein [Mesorhizobium sp.]RWM58469.1 MAG: PhzF family phenazine biosynthesis protein [Mesorhizobium sp.]RWN04440.1 MAG: PhzF family phenazine biosynthesis protein [Mesorhizobium sp.]
MSRTIPFHFVDVFAVEPLTGNSLAVVDGGGELALELMQNIAREFNQSETTFVLPATREDADWKLRSFTPKGVEVFGAGGHNTLGAWWWLAAAGRLDLSDGPTRFHQQIGDLVYPLAIWQSQGKLEKVIMQQGVPVAGRQLSNLGALAKALGLDAEEMAADVVPCQVVSTGAAHLLAPIRDREAVDRISPDAKQLIDLLNEVGGEGCYVFSLDPRQPGATAYARSFSPTVGISEDPATGTAAGPLAAHLVAHGLVQPGVIKIEQGTALGRTSIIEVDVDAGSVSVSGRGIVVASGAFSI